MSKGWWAHQDHNARVMWLYKRELWYGGNYISVSIEEAIRILDPETSADAIAEIEYYAGFNRDKTIEKINEACAIACDVMREHLSSKNDYK